MGVGVPKEAEKRRERGRREERRGEFNIFVSGYGAAVQGRTLVEAGFCLSNLFVLDMGNL